MKFKSTKASTKSSEKQERILPLPDEQGNLILRGPSCHEYKLDADAYYCSNNKHNRLDTLTIGSNTNDIKIDSTTLAAIIIHGSSIRDISICARSLRSLVIYGHDIDSITIDAEASPMYDIVIQGNNIKAVKIKTRFVHRVRVIATDAGINNVLIKAYDNIGMIFARGTDISRFRLVSPRVREWNIRGSNVNVTHNRVPLLGRRVDKSHHYNVPDWMYGRDEVGIDPICALLG